MALPVMVALFGLSDLQFRGWGKLSLGGAGPWVLDADGAGHSHVTLALRVLAHGDGSCDKWGGNL
ncbi:MAG: hypothetical protein WBH04_15835 [Albidovulum sp.]